MSINIIIILDSRFSTIIKEKKTLVTTEVEFLQTRNLSWQKKQQYQSTKEQKTSRVNKETK